MIIFVFVAATKTPSFDAFLHIPEQSQARDGPCLNVALHHPPQTAEAFPIHLSMRMSDRSWMSYLVGITIMGCGRIIVSTR
ncbi:hypothetical protein PM082_018767 [Marasmius tenuissimus]|nr:hypothetical protein PM082_018767 [Marasmius tenuissimus]